jgi:hypothetical protein
VTSAGSIKLLDFGIARVRGATEVGTITAGWRSIGVAGRF